MSLSSRLLQLFGVLAWVTLDASLQNQVSMTLRLLGDVAQCDLHRDATRDACAVKQVFDLLRHETISQRFESGVYLSGSSSLKTSRAEVPALGGEGGMLLHPVAFVSLF